MPILGICLILISISWTGLSFILNPPKSSETVSSLSHCVKEWEPSSRQLITNCQAEFVSGRSGWVRYKGDYTDKVVAKHLFGHTFYEGDN